MSSVSLIQSNVDSLPPPTADVAFLDEFLRHTSYPALPSPTSRPQNKPTTKRIVNSIRYCSAEESKNWFRDAMLTRWKSYQERLEECRNQPTAESVHELRVAIRRLISQLVLVNQVFPARKSQKVRRILKRQLESLGDLRDTQVQQTLFRRQVTRFHGLADLLARLERRERALVRRAARKIVRFKTKKVECWANKVSDLLRHGSDNPLTRQEIADNALQIANAAFSEVIGRRRLIDRSDVRTIHRTRVAFKKFRYVAEVLPPELSGLSRGQLRALAKYQRKMGNVQDLEVIQRCVNEFNERHEEAESLLRPFCKYLRRCRARAHRSFWKTADELFAFWQIRNGVDQEILGQPQTAASLSL